MNGDKLGQLAKEHFNKNRLTGLGGLFLKKIPSS